jgi:hypothetical protein
MKSRGQIEDEEYEKKRRLESPEIEAEDRTLRS